MGRRAKKNNIKRKCLYLDGEIDLLANNRAKQLGLSFTEYIEMLINNDANSNNPVKHLKQLEEQENKINETLVEIKLKKKEIFRQIEAYEQFQKNKKNKKSEAIEILKRKIINGDSPEEIERIATTWAARLGLEKYELIFIAGREIKKDVIRNV